MFRQGLATEVRWFIFIFVLVGIIGLILDVFFQAIVIYLFLYIIRLYVLMRQLADWITSVRHGGPTNHDYSSIWGEMADEVTRLYNLYQKDKQRLQSVVQKVENMTSALEDGVVLIDKRANVEWWNNSAQNLFDFRDVDKGHRLENIIRNPKFILYFEKEDYSEPLVLESLRREDQFLEFRVHPYGIGERLVVIREVTRVKKLEQMRKEFVANVSHELRTPLTVIRGYIETLADMPGLPKPLEKALDQMHQQGQRMTTLINDLITLNKIETDSIDSSQEPVALVPLIERVLSDGRALSTNGNHVLKRSGEEDIYILGNASLLHSAISNLVFNAVKYSPKGCTVEVQVTMFGNECIVSVIDNGVGIDSKHLPRLTERFYRVDDGRATSTGGTGLGLAIVKHVLFRHEAELKIRSRLGQGSTFSCHFPVKRIERKELEEVLEDSE